MDNIYHNNTHTDSYGDRQGESTAVMMETLCRDNICNFFKPLFKLTLLIQLSVVVFDHCFIVKQAKPDAL